MMSHRNRNRPERPSSQLYTANISDAICDQEKIRYHKIAPPAAHFSKELTRPMRITLLTPQRLFGCRVHPDCRPLFETFGRLHSGVINTDARATTLLEQREAVLRSATVIRKHWHSGKQSRAASPKSGPANCIESVIFNSRASCSNSSRCPH